MSDPPPPNPRRLIIHFNVPKTIILSDLDGRGGGSSGSTGGSGISTDYLIKSELCNVVWGTVNAETSEWVLAHPDVSEDRPSEDLISYTEYLSVAHPVSDDNNKFTNDENSSIQKQKILDFCKPGNPGIKVKTSLDQLIKCITFPKAVGKSFGVDKPNLEDLVTSETPPGAPGIYKKENSTDGPGNIVYSVNNSTNVVTSQCPAIGGGSAVIEGIANNISRYGRFIIVPAFYYLIQNLIKQKREFTIIIHSNSDEYSFNQVIEEINAFCDGYHPCYNGANKTKKFIANGDKSTPDLRISPFEYGVIKRNGDSIGGLVGDNTILEFEKRPKSLPFPGLDEIPMVFDSCSFKGLGQIYSGIVHNVGLGKALLSTIETAISSSNNGQVAQQNEDGGDGNGDGEGEGGDEGGSSAKRPLPEPCNQCILAIREDYDFWSIRGFNHQFAKTYFIDSGDSDVQQIYFDGCCSFSSDIEGFGSNSSATATVSEKDRLEDMERNNALTIQEVVGGKQLCFSELYGVHTYDVNPRKLLLNPAYFAEAVDECELGFEKKLIESRKKKSTTDSNTAATSKSKSDSDSNSLDLLRDLDLDTKEYLYKNIIPALFPALEQCSKIRPEDPLEFISFYLMRHGNGYEKTLHN